MEKNLFSILAMPVGQSDLARGPLIEDPWYTGLK